MTPFAAGLHFPTSIAFAPDGTCYLGESGLQFGGAPAGGRVIQLARDGSRVCLVNNLRAPLNGLAWLDENSLVVSEGGNPGRISKLDLRSRALTTILDGLPGFGNYHTNMAIPGPDGKLYFSQGALTNSGIMGLDSHELAWLGEISHDCDIPGYDVEVRGFGVTTADPRGANGATTRTSAFAPFGSVLPQRTIAARLPCTAAVMRCNPDGSDLELVAWGLRNAYGLGFLKDGRLVATDQGADARGSRPITKCPDFLYEVRSGAWYGWPDFYGGRPGTSSDQFVLANHDALPPAERALVEFEVNACATKFAVIPEPLPFAGDLLLTLFGDEKPMTAPDGPPIGRKLVRVSTRDWSLREVAMPVPLARPIDVAFCPLSGDAYIVDFGYFEMTAGKGPDAKAGSGCVWRVGAQQLFREPASARGFVQKSAQTVAAVF